MTRYLDDRPPGVITIEQLNHAQWEGISDAGDFASGISDFVTAVGMAIDWARFHGDAVVIEPYLADRLMMLRPARAAPAWGRCK